VDTPRPSPRTNRTRRAPRCSQVREGQGGEAVHRARGLVRPQPALLSVRATCASGLYGAGERYASDLYRGGRDVRPICTGGGGGPLFLSPPSNRWRRRAAEAVHAGAARGAMRKTSSAAAPPAPETLNPPSLHLSLAPETLNPLSLHLSLAPETLNPLSLHLSLAPETLNPLSLHLSLAPGSTRTWSPGSALTPQASTGCGADRTEGRRF